MSLVSPIRLGYDAGMSNHTAAATTVRSLSPRAIAVYCASAADLEPAILEAGRRLGAGIAKAGHAMVYGGTDCGLMKITSDACRNAGGKVIGVIPTFMIEKGLLATGPTQTVTVEDMARRKAVMAEHSGAFVILPGGLGTLDELFDILVLRQLQTHDKPIVLISIDGFFEPLVAMIDSFIARKTIRPEYKKLFTVVSTPEEALQVLVG